MIIADILCGSQDFSLLPDPQLLNQGAVPLHIHLFQVVQEVPPLTHEFQETPAGVMILYMGLEMLRQVIDPLAQDSDLDLGRPRVRGMSLIPLDDGLLPLWQ